MSFARCLVYDQLYKTTNSNIAKKSSDHFLSPNLNEWVNPQISESRRDIYMRVTQIMNFFQLKNATLMQYILLFTSTLNARIFFTDKMWHLTGYSQIELLLLHSLTSDNLNHFHLLKIAYDIQPSLCDILYVFYWNGPVQTYIRIFELGHFTK